MYGKRNWKSNQMPLLQKPASNQKRAEENRTARVNSKVFLQGLHEKVYC